MSEINTLIDIRELVPLEYNKTIELTKLCAIEVLDKHVSRVIELTSHIRNEELRDFMHIKLCKRYTNSTVAVIYGKTKDMNRITNEGIEIFNHLSPKVSKSPPMSKRQLKEWSLSWPLIYNKNSWEPKIFSDEEKKKALELLKRAVKVGKTRGDRSSGCIITYNEKTIAEVWDKRDSCVLDHSVIVAINSISQRIIKYGKSDDFPEYLCVGCDVYLSNEPCAMCAMALIHSRVSNVYYAIRDTINGALGSNHNIHHLKPLNHSYRAFEGIFSSF